MREMVAEIDAKEKLGFFFENYEKILSQGLLGKLDIETASPLFAETFVEADPRGVTSCQNNEKLRGSIMKDIELYRSIGTTKITIDQIQISELDSFHYMAHVIWKAYYIKKDKSMAHIKFKIIYMLKMIHDEPKIFAYITGEEVKAMRETGLI